MKSIKDAIAGMVEAHREKGLNREHQDHYRQEVVLKVAKGYLSQDDVQALWAIQKRYQLDPATAFEIHKSVWTDIVRRVAGMPNVDDTLLQQVSMMGGAFGLNWNHLPPNLAQQISSIAARNNIQRYVASTIAGIQQGQLPVLPVGSHQMNTTADEVVHSWSPCSLLDERTYRQYVGGSHGVSFRIAKGVYYHTGSTRGRSIPVTQIVTVDSGFLGITNKRVAFVGMKSSISAEWKKVLAAEPASDGVMFAFTSRKKNALIHYADSTYSEVIAALVSFYVA